MDYICNKCYITRAKTNRPFRFTQCKHIFCDNCAKDVAERCTVCGFKRPASILLQEPLPPEVASYFVPLDETLGSLRTAAGIQSVQLNIILERFHEIKNKYDYLKNNYCKVTRKTEYLIQKCSKYKNNIKEMKEAVNYYKDLSSYTNVSSTNSVVSMDIQQLKNDSCFSVSDTTPATFRVPTSWKVPKSAQKSSPNSSHSSRTTKES